MQTTFPIWLGVLVAVAVPLLSAFIAVSGVCYSQRLTNRSEAERRVHERETKRMEIDQAKDLK